ncbi:AlkZ family DNA glycosylase [Flavobacterium sp. ANB]|uniref:winged helix DNA-binding domain-containing protein n=1 Tax=unclassified Flavobacterium TaxID=196869 RepID=UPI0012B9408D|nr:MULTISPECIES: winged helix DNA-binding domain-containing protein [unclassified Flavobacterium]MBF4517103.1 AlkZ family DNA glycosylase [Flavobacterium sp. ANB]MTD71840.1 winged helix DNA-binding domain-containing protein [Flavobacterium sp. LC2016-13]
MTHDEISHHRLISQKLIKTGPSSPQEIVHHLGAMQAQDYGMAKWAIGSRCDATEKEIEEAINSAQIIRTHILRPTWHFVASEDIYWMLDVSGPQVQRMTISSAKQYGYDVKKLNQTNSKIEKLLAGNNHLTREEIMQELDIKKSSNQDFLGAAIMMHAELEGLVCNGKMKGKQITYALLEERVQKPQTKLTKEEGLAKLAKRYFESHGPATLLDFSWWSGFSPTICKLIINAIELQLNSVLINEKTYLFINQSTNDNNLNKSLHFLPAFDEILISYKTREASILLEHQSKAFTNNGIFKPIILENGKVIGTWKRTIKKDHAKIETQFFNETDNAKKAILFEGLKAFENYLETKIIIE